MSISAESLRKLASLNLSSEQMAGVLSIIADGIEKEEQRKSKQAERKRKSRSCHATVTDLSQDTPLDGSNGFPHPSLTSLNPPKENPPIGGQKKIPTGFDDWWKVYPHRIGKGAAVNSYAKALLDSNPDELTAGVKRYISTKPPDQPWCNPATWLNQQRWKDEPAEVQNANTNASYSKYSDKPTQLDRSQAAVVEGLAQFRAGLAKQPGRSS